jgi:hypothetical protein
MSNLPAQNATSPIVGTAGAKKPNQWPWLAGLAALFLFHLCVFIPFTAQISPPGVDELDASWQEVMRWAHAQHIDFATRLVFTHGPLGYLSQFEGRDNFPQITAAWLLLATACFAANLRIAREFTSRAWLSLAWLAAAILLAGIPFGMTDTRMVLPAGLLLVVYFCCDQNPAGPTGSLLIVALSLFSLVKFSVFLFAAPIVLIIGTDQLLSRRRRQIRGRRPRPAPPHNYPAGSKI